MGKAEYASAVSAVKAMESFLLKQSDMEQLINATYTEFESVLLSTERQTLSDVWEMLKSYAPDSRELEILLYRNDFHNLKAVLKAMISNREPEHYIIEPSNVSVDVLKEAFRTKNSDILPDYMRETASEA
ncbi:MAG: V-type ATPase subunit, partial [Ruminococcus sp.]|nr:V-type ATPase subunit [Ruminococcus sp.]